MLDIELNTYYLVFDLVPKLDQPPNEVWYQIRLICNKYPLKIASTKAEV